MLLTDRQEMDPLEMPKDLKIYNTLILSYLYPPRNDRPGYGKGKMKK